MSLKGLSPQRREEIIAKMIEFRRDAEDGNRATWDRMTKGEMFKIGKQWEFEDSGWNESHGKFSLTINEILPVVLDISGTQTSNPNDIKVRNVKGGTRKIAEILSALAKNVMDKSDGEGQKSMSFEDGVTTARGFMGIDKSYEHDPDKGDFVVRKLNPFLIAPDPACTCYDYNDHENGAKFIIVDDWVDKDKVKIENPDEADKLAGADFNVHAQGRWGNLMSFMFRGFRRFNISDDYRNRDILDEPLEFTKEKRNFRVTTTWWREWKKGAYIQRVDDPLSVLALFKNADITEAKRLAEGNPRLKIIEKDNEGNQLSIPVLNKTKTVGDVLLDHIEDPFKGMNLFPVFRYTPHFDNGYEMGVVENLIDPQKTLNFSTSSMVNLMKQLANSGWIVGNANEKQKQFLEEHGSENGIVLSLKDYGSLTKIKNNDFPIGFDIISQRMSGAMRKTSQVRLAEPRTGRPESGKAKEIDELQSLKVQGVAFRNWKWTLQIMARTLINLIRNTDVFSEDEIRAIVEDEDLIDADILAEARNLVIQELEQGGIVMPEPPTPPDPTLLQQAEPVVQQTMLSTFQEELALFQQVQAQIDELAVPLAQGKLIDEIRNMRKGRYGIKIDTSPASATQRFLRQIETFKLNEALLASGQPGVSRKLLVESTDVPNQEEIIADVPQQPVAGAA